MGEEQRGGLNISWTDYAIQKMAAHVLSTEAYKCHWPELQRVDHANGNIGRACRGIDGTGRLFANEIRDTDERYSEQKGYGIHFFVGIDDGQGWDYQFTLPDPAGRFYAAWHESGEPCFCNTSSGELLIAYYSYDSTVFDTLGEGPMPTFTAAEARRIPHTFKRRICVCTVREHGVSRSRTEPGQ